MLLGWHCLTILMRTNLELANATMPNSSYLPFMRSDVGLDALCACGVLLQETSVCVLHGVATMHFP